MFFGRHVEMNKMFTFQPLKRLVSTTAKTANLRKKETISMLEKKILRQSQSGTPELQPNETHFVLLLPKKIWRQPIG